MLARGVFGVVRKGSRSNCAFKVSAQRSVVTFIDDNEKAEWETAEFINYTNTVGQDEFPHYRKEYLSPSEKRGMKANKAEGKKSNQRVRGLVQFIQLKQEMKYS
jgi:hypothetical protein